MPNEQNIIPHRFTSDQNREKAANNGRIGGKASGIARRRKKSLKEAADLYLSLPVSNMKKWNQIAKDGLDPDDINNQMAMIVGLTQAAIKGDAKAAKIIIDLIGETPTDGNDAGVTIIDDL